MKINSNLAKLLMESSDWRGQEEVTAKLSEAVETVEEEVVAEESEVISDETEELVEDSEAEVHVCPLCETVLENELTDEIVENHINYIAGLLSEDTVDEDSDPDE